MRGYKVLYRIHGKLVSKADRRLAFPAVVGQVLRMPAPGLFLSTSKQYVLDYYSDGADAEYEDPGMEEVLLTLEFTPADILRGNLTDDDPEAAVSSARVVSIEPTTGGRCENPLGVLPLAEVLRWRDEAAREGVSEVARSPRGFVHAYEAAGGRLDRLSPEWRSKREAFLARHLAQVAVHHEPLFDSQGLPTRRHLALVMWAYSPQQKRLAAAWQRQAKRRGNPAKPAKVLSMQAHRNKLAHENRLKINKIKTAYAQAIWNLGYTPLRTKKGTVNIRSFNMLKAIAGYVYESLDEIKDARRGNPSDVVSLDAWRAARVRSALEAKIVETLSRIARRIQHVDPETPDAQSALKFGANTLIDGHAKGWFQGP